MATMPGERPLGSLIVIPIKRHRRWRRRAGGVNPASMPTGGKYGWVVWVMAAVLIFFALGKMGLEAAGFDLTGIKFLGFLPSGVSP